MGGGRHLPLDQHERGFGDHACLRHRNEAGRLRCHRRPRARREAGLRRRRRRPGQDQGRVADLGQGRLRGPRHDPGKGGGEVRGGDHRPGGRAAGALRQHSDRPQVLRGPLRLRRGHGLEDAEGRRGPGQPELPAARPEGQRPAEQGHQQAPGRGERLQAREFPDLPPGHGDGHRAFRPPGQPAGQELPPGLPPRGRGQPGRAVLRREAERQALALPLLRHQVPQQVRGQERSLRLQGQGPGVRVLRHDGLQPVDRRPGGRRLRRGAGQPLLHGHHLARRGPGLGHRVLREGRHHHGGHLRPGADLGQRRRHGGDGPQDRRPALRGSATCWARGARSPRSGSGRARRTGPCR